MKLNLLEIIIVLFAAFIVATLIAVVWSVIAFAGFIALFFGGYMIIRGKPNQMTYLLLIVGFIFIAYGYISNTMTFTLPGADFIRGMILG
jgi:hypothetical protein